MDTYLHFLQEKLDETHSFYHMYKKSQDAIVYYGGTVFIGIVSVTGIFGAIQDKDLVTEFEWFHLLVFHTIFFIFYLFYNYKMMCAEVYLIMSLEIGNTIQRLMKISNSRNINVVLLKQQFVGDTFRVKSLKKGLNPGRLANILILVLYMTTTMVPFFFVEFQFENATLKTVLDSNILSLVVTVAFFVVFAIVERNIKRRRRNVRRDISTEIKKKLENLLQHASNDYVKVEP
jgi:hypothetical protein